ncbi:MAG: nicotinate phosphoribosyltransferase [Actinomycetota bacterium]|nr:nicotinate phosphoribosyltransferase [Acidimicrobiales bacterium]
MIHYWEMGTALLTDLYELTMLDAALSSEVAQRRATFEVFARRLPPGRGYGVVSGPNRLADLLADFTFSGEQLEYLAGLGRFSDELLSHVESFRFEGDVWSYREGDLYVPGSPVLRVDCQFGAGLLLETLVLSVLNHDCAVASAAARMHDVADGRHLIEMGGRRTHEQAAVAAARAAWLVGFDTTSNMEAGFRYGIPTAGTSAHAFILAHLDEEEAFEAQIRAHGLDTTLLVDTYEIDTGIDRALAAAKRLGGVPGAIRIDSGDLAHEALRARERLDEGGAETTRIVVSGDLDEYRIADLSNKPIDGYGVGTQLVVGSGHATAGMVYKLVAVARLSGTYEPVVPVAKSSEGKATRGGVVRPYRVLQKGEAFKEVLVEDNHPGPADARSLHVPLIRRGMKVYPYSLDSDRAFHQQARDELPSTMRSLDANPLFEAEVLGST